MLDALAGSSENIAKDQIHGLAARKQPLPVFAGEAGKQTICPGDTLYGWH